MGEQTGHDLLSSNHFLVRHLTGGDHDDDASLEVFLIEHVKAERLGRRWKKRRDYGRIHTLEPRAASAIGVPRPDLIVIVPAVCQDEVRERRAGRVAADGAPLALEAVPRPQLVGSSILYLIPGEHDLSAAGVRRQVRGRGGRSRKFGVRASRQIESLQMKGPLGIWTGGGEALGQA